MRLCGYPFANIYSRMYDFNMFNLSQSLSLQSCSLDYWILKAITSKWKKLSITFFFFFEAELIFLKSLFHFSHIWKKWACIIAWMSWLVIAMNIVFVRILFYGRREVNYTRVRAVEVVNYFNSNSSTLLFTYY